MTPDWTAAVCQQVDAGLFYGPDSESAGHRRSRETAAVAVCRTCPIILECRSAAYANREWHGVWGGVPEETRRQVFRAERVGRADWKSTCTARAKARVEAVDMAQRMHRRGVSVRDIAAHLGRAPDTVTRYIRDAERKAS